MSPEIIGLIGGIIVVVAWLWETSEAVRRHKKLIDLKFSAMFLIAAIFLTAYSWQRSDLVFFWLNIILIIILFVEIAFSIHVKKIHRKH